MNPYGTFTPSQFLPPAAPFFRDIGLNWEYIRIINNSPYALKISLGGQGSVDFPEGFLEDIPVNRSFNGKINIAPVQNYASTAIARSLANYVTVNAYRQGELAHPQAQPIGTLGSTANISQDFQAVFSTNAGLNISAAFNSVGINLTNTFPNIGQVSAAQPGFLLLGYLIAEGARELIVPFRQGYHEFRSLTFNVTIPNGGGAQTFQLTGSHAITGAAFYSWSNTTANVGVGSMSADRNDGIFFDVVPTPSVTGAAGTVQVSLVQQFGPYGLEGYAPGSGGLRLRCNFFNTTGGNVTVTLTLTGSNFAFDDAVLSILYTDWNSNPFGFGDIRLSEIARLPLNFLVPTPITNPAQTNFGTLTFQVLLTTEYYATKYFGNTYTLDIAVPASLIIPGSGS